MAKAAVENQGRKRALVISISQYDKLAALDFCESDGNKIYEVLTQLGYDIPIKYRLIGGRVEYDKLRDSILDFFNDKTIDPKDTVLFYFSGHGVLGDDGEHYLSTSEIDPDNPYRRGFPFDGLTKARGACNSKMVFTVLDCCYSGADKLGKGSAKGSDKAQEESASVAKNTIKEKSEIPGEGKCVLAACKPMQKAFEYKEKGHSFFSYYLSEALTSQECVDKDGDVTPYALNTYIDNKIRGLPADIRPKQTPFLNCSTAGKIVLAHHAKEIPATEWKGSKSDYLLKLLQEEKIEEFNKVRKEGDIPLYLRKIDLRGKNLSGVDLHEVDLSEAKLVSTKLITANLNGAKLKGADLSGADLRTANLYGANLSGANLTQADLRGADLKGMIDFSGANLSGADIRGVDLTGMVNFSGAKLYNVNFTESATDKGLINFSGADIRNAKGLPALHESNEYLEGLKSFSESIKQKFKTYNIPAEQIKPIEESVKALVKEVEDIQKPEDIDDGVKKKNINSKFVGMAKSVIKALPTTTKTETLAVFTPLAPFAKIIGKEIPQIIESIDKDIHVGTTSTEYHSVTSEHQVKPPGALSSSSSFQAPTYTKKDGRAEEEGIAPKKRLNKWIIILPIILVGIIGVVVAFSLQHAPEPSPIVQPIKPMQQNQTIPPVTKSQPQQRHVPSTISIANGYSFLKQWGSTNLTGNGQLRNPQGVAIDSAGNVYVADYGNNRIQKFTNNGTFIAKWGTNGTANGQFSSPADIAVDSAGNVYVADYGNNRIQKFNSNGTFIAAWGSWGNDIGQLQQPYSVAIDPKTQYVYVADRINNRIQVFSPSSYVSVIANNGRQ